MILSNSLPVASSMPTPDIMSSNDLRLDTSISATRVQYLGPQKSVSRRSFPIPAFSWSLFISMNFSTSARTFPGLQWKTSLTSIIFPPVRCLIQRCTQTTGKENDDCYRFRSRRISPLQGVGREGDCAAQRQRSFTRFGRRCQLDRYDLLAHLRKFEIPVHRFSDERWRKAVATSR